MSWNGPVSDTGCSHKRKIGDQMKQMKCWSVERLVMDADVGIINHLFCVTRHLMDNYCGATALSLDTRGVSKSQLLLVQCCMIW